MSKSFKKFLGLFMSILTAISVMGVTPTPVYAEGETGELTGIYKFSEYFTSESMAPLSAGYPTAAVLSDSNGEVLANLFCIEPDVYTGIGASYTNSQSPASDAVSGVIYAYHLDMLNDSGDALAKYLGAQIAVWAKIRGNAGAISGLVASSKDPDTANAAKGYASSINLRTSKSAYGVIASQRSSEVVLP